MSTPVKLDYEGLLYLIQETAAMLEHCEDARSIQEMHLLLSRILSASLQKKSDNDAQIQDFHKRIAGEAENLKKMALEGDSSHIQTQLQRRLQAELREQEKLQEDARIAEEYLEALKEQQKSIRTKKDALKKAQRDVLQTRQVLTLCASVFHMIPFLDGTDRICGNVVDENGNILETFDLGSPDTPDLDLREKFSRMSLNVGSGYETPSRST